MLHFWPSMVLSFCGNLLVCGFKIYFVYDPWEETTTNGCVLYDG